MTNYHDRPEVSATMLKSMASGWRTFEAEHITKTATRKETPAMALGTAVHCALLEPGAFGERYAVCPSDCSDRRTKAYKEWAATVSPDQKVLSVADWLTISAIRDRCFSHNRIGPLLTLTAKVEEEVYWNEPETGTDCRAKIDFLAAAGIVVDVKTTDDARPEAFARTIGKFRYDLQASHYLDGTKADVFIFLAVETSAPYRCRLYELSEADLSSANQWRLRLLDSYRDRLAAGDWSEAGESEVTKLFLPNYLRGQE